MNELAQLGFLELSNNQIDTLPLFDRLDKLEELYVNDNQLKELPVRIMQHAGENEVRLRLVCPFYQGSVAFLPALMHLDISNNQVTRIPKVLTCGTRSGGSDRSSSTFL